MLKMITARTTEIDEVADAVEEIRGQLGAEYEQYPNVLGIMTYHTEYVESGVVAALCQALPFPIVGCSTLASGTGGQCGALDLTLALLLSDDVSFRTVRTPALTLENTERVMAETLEPFLAAQSEKPALLFDLQPLLIPVPGELIFSALLSHLEDVPVFGTAPCDSTPGFSASTTLFEGKVEADSAVLTFFYGNVRPRFVVATVPPGNIQRQRGVITQSENCVLRQVNNIPLREYMASLGITQQEALDFTRTMPCFIDYNDGTEPVARAIYDMQADGSAICCGYTPVGATLAVATIGRADVIDTSREAISDLLSRAGDDGQALLLISCASRNFALGGDMLGEMEGVAACIGDSLPYLMCYSGSEICPTTREDGSTVNRFHNFTFVGCLL